MTFPRFLSRFSNVEHNNSLSRNRQYSSKSPPDSRPILVDSVASCNRHNLEESAELIANYVECELLPRHVGEKGVIHATYQMSGLLKKYLRSETFLFHDRFNKSEVYEQFRKSPPESGKVLVACGMYEGIDLPNDLGRWQVISKIPWLSLGNPAVKFLADKEPDYYLWETLRVVIQACGRICRTPTDQGITYIADATVERLLTQADHLLPTYFREALRGGVDENDHTVGGREALRG